MQFSITVYQDEEGWYIAECPAIPGCMSQGKTQAEAMQNVQEAIQLCLEVRHAQGLSLIEESTELAQSIRHRTFDF